MPGERYLRLVDDLHGNDPEKRKQAQDFLRSLAGIDVKRPYVVSVWFEFDQQSPVHPDVFRAPSPAPDHVKERVLSRAPNLTAPVASTPLRPPTQAEIEASLDQALRRFISSMRGSPSITFETKGGFGSLTHDGTLSWPDNKLYPTLSRSIPGTRANPRKAKEDFDAEFNQLISSSEQIMVDNLKAAIRTLYANRQLPISSTTIQRDWSLFDNQQFLFVLIPEDDWLRHKESLTIKAVVHADGNPDQTFNHMAVYTFPCKDFTKATVQRGGNSEAVYWATHNMTGVSIFADPEVSAKLSKLREAMAEWEELERQP